MADLAMVSEGKPLAHKSVSDWLCGVWGLRQASQTARADSFLLRQSSNTLRNETRIKTEYDKYQNDLRLHDRLVRRINFTVNCVSPHYRSAH